MTEFDARPEGEGTLYPVLPLRDIVVFPHMIVPLFVGREKSIRALEEVMAADKQILLATQVNASDDDPSPSDIYEIGTLATVLQLLKLPDNKEFVAENIGQLERSAVNTSLVSVVKTGHLKERQGERDGAWRLSVLGRTYEVRAELKKVRWEGAGAGQGLKLSNNF